MLILYTTLGCHLCEQAQHIVYHESNVDVRLKLVDIADDESLMETYGIRIPVLKHEQSGAEIGWPFSAQEFNAWFTGLVGSE